MVYFQEMTPDGYQKIQEEMAQLKKLRPHRIKLLQEARSLGDLSENSEYTEAKRDLGHLNSRLRYLGKQLKYAKVVEPQDDGRVHLGSHVVLAFDDGEVAHYQLVGRLQAAPEAGLLAFDSKLGQALLGRRVGDHVMIAAPAGSYTVNLQQVTL